MDIKKTLHSTITYATVSHIHSVLAVFHLHNNPLRKIDSFRIYSLQFYSHVTYSSSQDRLFLYLFSEILCCFHFALFLSVDQYISLRVADVFSGQQQLFSFPFLCRSLMRKQADWGWRRVTWAGYGAVGLRSRCCVNSASYRCGWISVSISPDKQIVQNTRTRPNWCATALVCIEDTHIQIIL